MVLEINHVRMCVPKPKLSNKMNAVCTVTAVRFLRILVFTCFENHAWLSQVTAWSLE